MNQQILIAPSILSADWSRLKEEVEAVERAGADWLHLDVMDGHFVPPITFGADFVRTIRRLTKLPLDVHLMIDEQDQHLEAFAEACADSITVHQEAAPHLHRTVQTIHKLGKLAGVAVNPGTPYTTLESILHDVDLVLVMTVNPGWGGQRFIDTCIEKIRALRLMLAQMGRDVHVEIDGGVVPETAKRAIAAGADVLVAGSSVFHAQSRTEAGYREAIQSLRALPNASK